MLTELAEDLHRREVRLMLMHVITPVRQMLDKVGAINKIGPENLFIGPPEAVLEYLSSQSDAAGILELLRSGASSAVTLLQAGMSTAPADRQAELAAIVESLEKEIT